MKAMKLHSFLFLFQHLRSFASVRSSFRVFFYCSSELPEHQGQASPGAYFLAALYTREKPVDLVKCRGLDFDVVGQILLREPVRFLIHC